ncbi:ABC transporter ATP-binding protein [Quatrionicoccus australiensis]|uniref:ABC transporter ATP-binding protein n=1 Tax=Quatrionicoccus australiensis TaxID=138118 RepID=UPI001CF87415|nr:ABC transporter ATP-binding protein [Quatrionicoccus australiensis]UCV13412.1 ABC transporter ATP-binding protein [Quatrionicoccus australiensis]
MIYLDNVTKSYETRNGRNVVLKNASLKIEMGQRVGILGRNGAGKSTLIKIISGVEAPTSGTVTRKMSVSWPLAFAGGFQGSLSGLDNIRFISRVYGVNFYKIRPFIEDFTELGSYLLEPVKTYSSGMRARLAFGLTMAIEFDCYLIDEVIAVGDSRFHAKCHYELFEQRSDRALLLVSHDPGNIREYCNTAAILRNGKLDSFNSIDEAYSEYTNE